MDEECKPKENRLLFYWKNMMELDEFITFITLKGAHVQKIDVEDVRGNPVICGNVSCRATELHKPLRCKDRDVG